MPSRWQHRRSPNATPRVGDLLEGEIGIRFDDRKIFTEDGTGIVQIGGGTLDAVTDGGNVTTNDITVGGFTATANARVDGTVTIQPFAGGGADQVVLADNAGILSVETPLDTPSAGGISTADAGRLIRLNSNGSLDHKFLEAAMHYAGVVDPAAMPAGPEDNTVVFFNAPGNVAGTAVAAGDMAFFNGTSWDLVMGKGALSDYYAKAEYLNVSAGPADAGKPVVLNAVGRLDTTMMSLPPVLVFRGSIDPAALPTNPNLGDLYVAKVAGPVGGEQANVSDWILWDGAQWDVVAAVHDLTAYVYRDGSTPMTGPLAMTNNRITGLGAPTAGTDAATRAFVEAEVNSLLPAAGVGQLTNNGAGTLTWVNHRTDGQNDARYARAAHQHPFTDITGVATTVQIPNLPATKITSGKLALARLPTGTTATTVALGNHTHTGMVTAPANMAANRLVIATGPRTEKTGTLLTNAAGTWLGVGVNPAQPLHVNGAAVVTGDITAFYSDIRLKDIEGPVVDALWKVQQLEAFYYKPNDRAFEVGAANDEDTRVGLSAQDVAKVLPEIVKRAPFDMLPDGSSMTGEDYLTVDYAKVVPLLVEAIKELAEKVEELS